MFSTGPRDYCCAEPFQIDPGLAHNLARFCRPEQWIKNLFVGAPLNGSNISYRLKSHGYDFSGGVDPL
jgi:hypothetical protein